MDDPDDGSKQRGPEYGEPYSRLAAPRFPPHLRRSIDPTANSLLGGGENLNGVGMNIASRLVRGNGYGNLLVFLQTEISQGNKAML